MITMRVSQAAAALNVAYTGPDPEFLGCSTDSRSLTEGALFVALRGSNFDGHQFVDHAHAKGAVAAIVEHGSVQALPVIRVSDTQQALGKLAENWRDRFSLPLVAVTGSNGKTTVKELLASIFGAAGPVLATHGNLNNTIGVPLTLLGLCEWHRFAVVEMGANQPGEIALLARIARPTVGVITQCGAAHLEGFGSIEGVARAKGELFEALGETAIAAINADDPHAPLWERLAGGRRCIRFGLENEADVSATWSPDSQKPAVRGGSEGMQIGLETPVGRGTVRLRLPGRHNVINALAATTAALAAGMTMDTIIAGLESVRPIGGRLQAKAGSRGARVIDDTYNANPTSLEAALAVLGGYGGRRWLVLGDMGELGENASLYHQRAGELARTYAVDRLYATGKTSKLAAAAFGKGGHYYENQADLIDAVGADIAGDVTLLIKGSRAMRMERVVAALTREVLPSSGVPSEGISRATLCIPQNGEA